MDYRLSMSEETTGDSQTANNLPWCISCSKDGIVAAQSELDCDDLKGDFTGLIGFTKPHPLSSPVNKYSSLIRAQTFSSVLDNVDIPVETSSARNFSKAPLRLKFALSPKGAAWNLEDDEDIESAISCCTDGVPFGYTAGGLYYSTDQHLQLLHSTVQGCKEDCPLSSETEKKHSVIKETRISKLARRFSQRKEKINIRKEERSHSLEDLESSQQAKLQQASNKSPKLQRTMSVIQRSSPRLRLSVQENRFSFNNKDFKEKYKKKKTDASVDALIEAIVRNESDHMRNILESELIDVNGLNDDGFSPLDVAVMLGRPSVIKMLLLYGAQEGTKLPNNYLSKHINMLLKEAELRVDDLTTVVVHVNFTNSSEVKENERLLQDWLWRKHLLEQIKKGLTRMGLPDKPGRVTISVASEDSLIVRFIEPLDEKAIVSKYKIQWSKSPNFMLLDGEHILRDLRSLEYTMCKLKKSVSYYVRVCCGNLKGFGSWLESTPSCAMPSTWHEVDDSKPRFQGRLNVIDDLFGRVWQSHEDFSPFRPIVAHRLRSNTIQNETASECGVSPRTSRKSTMKKSLTKYTNLLFHAAPKFSRHLKRGVYLASILFTDDKKLLVTLDENIPIIAVDDSHPSTFLQDFCWLMKVACTWKDVKKLKEEIEKKSSSTSLLFRCKLLHAAHTLQGALGKQDLGRLHYKPVKDRNGSTVIVAVNFVMRASSFRPRIMSLKWTSLSKLQKKTQTAPLLESLQNELFSASEILLCSIQEKIQYFENSTKCLERGLYIGYLKLRTSVDAIHVVVQENCPNVLPHVKIRDNPNVSREEWQWLQTLDAFKETQEPSKTAHEFHVLVAKAAETLMGKLGIGKEASRLHRLYDREVVELDENVSFIIVFPPPEEVCSAPGQLDCLSHQKSFISMSVQTFEMMHMFTYQQEFICHYSRLSSVLDMDSVICQQALREAFSPTEVQIAKARQEQLLDFQGELDETWQGMRWILDALHYARDRQIKGGIPLAEVYEYSRSYSDDHCSFCSSNVKDKVTCGGGDSFLCSSCGSPKEGVLQIHTSSETSLPPGATITLHVTPNTTACQVVKMVVQELSRKCHNRTDKTERWSCLSPLKHKGLCLVAVIGGQEKCLKDDFKPLQLQNPWKRGGLYVRLRSEAIAATSSSNCYSNV
ncbi:ankyrin repeat and fibronectin type-III domain-containing protein 1-like isoform X2 [Acropora palmata]|uniref:ankyrin repeat and fibronectin type-III domain-containing protein 1-like isoform X2 n=1 Tax=Acropora palmata TaxID=6131 RepID=UPI003D9FC096